MAVTKYLDKTGLAYLWSKIKAWCNSLFALDNAVVHNTGAESISGTKKFSGSIQVTNNAETPRMLSFGSNANGNAGIWDSTNSKWLLYSNESGTAYFKGTADAVPWSGITGIPSSFTPSSHAHGNITNDGKLGTASRAVVTDGNKLVTVSSVTSTELGYLSGTTSNVQTQLNAKAADNNVLHLTGTEYASGRKVFYSDRTRGVAGHTSSAIDPLAVKHSLIERGVYPTVLSSGSNEEDDSDSTVLGTQYLALDFLDKNNKRLGMLEYSVRPSALPNNNSQVDLKLSLYNFTNALNEVEDFHSFVLGYDSVNDVYFAACPPTKEERTAFGYDIVTRNWIPKDDRIVHIDGREFINGLKFFNQHYNVQLPIVRGTTPSSAVSGGFTFCDNTAFSAGSNPDTKRFSEVAGFVGSDGSSHLLLRAYKNASGGNSSSVLEVVYPASGDPYAAAPSTSENRSVGTDIVTRDWIPKDTRIVHTTDEEEINGAKIFNSRLCIYGQFINAARFKYNNVTIPNALPPADTIYYRGYDIVDSNGRDLVDCYHRISNTGTHSKVWQMHNTKATDATQQFAFTYNASTDKFYLSGPAQFDADDDSTKIPNTAWIRDATGNFACNAATATKLKTARTINGVSFDGSANITIADSTKLPLSGGTMTGSVIFEKTATLSGTSTTHNASITMNGNSLNFGAYDHTFSKWIWTITPYGNVYFYGNADTATKLATARSLKVKLDSTTDITFDGSADQNAIPVTGTLSVANGGTGLASLDTFIRTTGNQTIGGSKTFTALPVIDRTGSTLAAGALAHVLVCKYKNSADNVDFTTYPISVIGNDAANANNIGIRLGSINGTTIVTAGESGSTFASTVGKYNDENLYLTADNEIQMYVKCTNDSTSYAGPITFSGTAASSGTNSTTTVTATTFNGNANTATKLAASKTIAISGGATGTATAFDGSGNITIPVTALDVSKASAGTLAVGRGGTGATTLDGAGIVTKSGDQTVGGQKTFSSSPIITRVNPYLTFKETDFEMGVVPDATSYQGIIFNDKNDNHAAMIYYNYYTTKSGYLRFYVYNSTDTTDTTAYVYVYGYAAGIGPVLRPESNNTILLGMNSFRWKEIWCTQNSLNSASDKRLKNSIDNIPDEILDAWEDINWIQYKFNDAVKEKGSNARFHCGLIAQDLNDIFKSKKLDISRYGLFLHDSWEASPEERSKDGELIANATEAGDCYGLRYTEALAVEAAYQRRKNKILENRISELEKQVSDMIILLQNLTNSNG